MSKINENLNFDTTRILGEGSTKLNGYPVKFETWNWDGIYGSSIIFKTKDVAHLTEEEIVELVKSSEYCKDDSDTTFKQTDSGETFVNFNFELDDD